MVNNLPSTLLIYPSLFRLMQAKHVRMHTETEAYSSSPASGLIICVYRNCVSYTHMSCIGVRMTYWLCTTRIHGSTQLCDRTIHNTWGIPAHFRCVPQNVVQHECMNVCVCVVSVCLCGFGARMGHMAVYTVWGKLWNRDLSGPILSRRFDDNCWWSGPDWLSFNIFIMIIFSVLSLIHY